MRRGAWIGALLALVPLTACEKDCIPTWTSPRNASRIEVNNLEASGILRARLTSQRKPLSGKVLVFSLEDDRIGAARTKADGWATLDLKDHAQALVENTDDDRWIAYFEGDARRCPSGNAAALTIART